MTTHLNLFDQFLQIVKLLETQRLHVGKVDRIILVAIRAYVLVNVVCLALQYSNAPSVEPVLALITANVELRFVVRLTAEAVQLLRVPGVLTLPANVLGDLLRLRLTDANAVSVEPIVTQIATNVEPNGLGGKRKTSWVTRVCPFLTG